MTLWVTNKRNPLPKTFTGCPSGWEDTTAAADNMAARIRNSTFVAAGGVDFVTVPLDYAASIDIINLAVMAPSIEVGIPRGSPVPTRPDRYRKYKLADLMGGFEAKHRHSETDWGKPSGKEV